MKNAKRLATEGQRDNEKVEFSLVARGGRPTGN